MSYINRLKRLERISLDTSIWALIGLGKPKDAQHQRLLEIQARDDFHISGGDKRAYLAFLPFNSFEFGFLGYVTKSELTSLIMNKSKNPAES